MSQNRILATLVLAVALLAGACGSADSDSTATDNGDTVAADSGDTDTGDTGGDSSAAELSYPLTDTGQTLFYDSSGEVDDSQEAALPGQDAAYSGNQMSFADNADGTVTDNVTGLVWEQDPTDTSTVWQEAVDYCAALDLAGSTEWRVPSLKELFSISDFGEGWPYIDTDYFFLVDTPVEKDQQFWSSNYYEVDTELAAQDQAFGVNHMTGHIKAYSDGAARIDGDGTDAGAPPQGAPSDTEGSPPEGEGRPEGEGPPDGEGPPEGEGPPDGEGPPEGAGDSSPASKYVRCVLGDDYGINDFVDNGDGTITDAATGLMWAQPDSGQGVDWEAALLSAEEASDQEYLGHTGWRVPNVKELQSIVDYSGVYPAIDTGLFEVTDEDSYFWTSTSAYFSTQNPGYFYAWYVAAGYAVDGDGADSHGAGAVRFDTKKEGGPAAEEPERIYNFVRLVRDA